MRSRWIPSWLLLAVLAGCATPPGHPEPTAINYQEEAQAIGIYRKYAKGLQAVPGVETTYLTSNNNPRRVVVVVKNPTAIADVRAQFGKDLEGLKLKFETFEKDRFEGDDPITQVAKVEQPKTWWDRVVFFLKAIKSRFTAGGTAPEKL